MELNSGAVSRGNEYERTASQVSINKNAVTLKVNCRYGSGCTHMLDPAHREKFKHPFAPKLNGSILSSANV